MWAQACDKHEGNKKMNIEIEELCAPWVIEKWPTVWALLQGPHGTSRSQSSRRGTPGWAGGGGIQAGSCPLTPSPLCISIQDLTPPPWGGVQGLHPTPYHVPPQTSAWVHTCSHVHGRLPPEEKWMTAQSAQSWGYTRTKPFVHPVRPPQQQPMDFPNPPSSRASDVPGHRAVPGLPCPNCS